MKWYPVLDHTADAPVLLAQVHGESPTTHTSTTEHHEEHGDSHGAHHGPWVFFASSMAAFLVIVIIAILGTRRLQLVPKRAQNALEMIVETLYGIPEMVMGPRGRAYAPFIATFFVYILVMNLIGFIPGALPGTASLSITLGLAIVAFVAVQYYGFQAHGIRYLAHFLGPVPAMAFLILPLELVSELARPVSLSMRLYGNISGEEQVLAALANFFNPLVAVLILPLQVLTAFLQAFVFALLVAVYIGLATEKHGDEHHAATSSEVKAP